MDSGHVVDLDADVVTCSADGCDYRCALPHGSTDELFECWRRWHRHNARPQTTEDALLTLGERLVELWREIRRALAGDLRSLAYWIDPEEPS